MDRLHAAPTELGSIYWPRSINRSRLTALSIRYACRRFNGASETLCAKQPNGRPSIALHKLARIKPTFVFLEGFGIA
jgi:hypothetical protein